MGKKKARVTENAWPSNRTVTRPVDYPQRLTVQVDAGDLVALLDGIVWAIGSAEAAGAGGAAELLGKLHDDYVLDSMLWEPLQEVLDGIRPEGVTIDDGDLLDSLRRGSRLRRSLDE